MDIVERLRDPGVFVDRNEVADEIERLRAARDECERQYQEQVALVGRLMDGRQHER